MRLTDTLMIALTAVSVAMVIIVLLQKDRDTSFGKAGDVQQGTYWGKNRKHSMEGRLILLTRLLGAALLALAAVLSVLQ